MRAYRDRRLVAAWLLTCSIAPAWAQADLPTTRCPEPKPKEAREASNIVADVKAFDIDGDGFLTRDEFRRYLVACDRIVRAAKQPEKRESAVEDAFSDLQVQDSGDKCPAGKDCLGNLHSAQALAILRDLDGVEIEKSPPLKPFAAKPRFSIGRSIADGANPFAKGEVASTPFIISYQNDYEKDEEAGLLLGKVSYGPIYWGTSPDGIEDVWSGALSTTFDVNTGKAREESTITFGASATYTGSWSETNADGVPVNTSGYDLSISPEYVTDGNADRDVVSLRVKFTPFGHDFGGAGQWKDFARGYFSWTPSLSAACGEVRDDGGSAALAAIKADGAWCRLQPAIDLNWERQSNAHVFGMRLGYAQTYDLQENWDRGYGEFELRYGLKDSPLQLVLLYREGRKEPAFDVKRSLVFGIGIKR